MDCGVDSAGDSSVQAFEEDSGVGSMGGLKNVGFSLTFSMIIGDSDVKLLILHFESFLFFY